MTLMVIPTGIKTAQESARNGQVPNNGTAFIYPLNASGSGPATHWGCCGHLNTAQRAAVEAACAPATFIDYDPVSNPSGAKVGLVGLGRKKTAG